MRKTGKVTKKAGTSSEISACFLSQLTKALADTNNFLYEFTDDNFEKVSKEGWTRAANSINANNAGITFITMEDYFCCCYQTAIGTSNCFIKEFEQAYQTIGGAMSDYNKIYPYIERDYPNTISEHKTCIGFK